MPIERPLDSRRIYDGHVVSLRVDEVELPSGRHVVREIVEHRGAVAIVPLVDRDVLLVKQYRAAVGRTLMEIPAGSIEPDETVEACVQRELAEEIGMRAGRVDRLATFYPSPGFLTEIVHVYRARDLTPFRLQAEEEDLSVVRVSLTEAQKLVATGEIVDAKSIIGLLLIDRRTEPSR